MQIRFCTIGFVIYFLSNCVVCICPGASLHIEKTLTKTEGLASDTVLTIFQDSQGNLWFGTNVGVTRYNGTDFKTFTTEDGLARDTIGLIFEDRQEMLWFADGVLSDLLERGQTVDMSWMEIPLSELADMPEEETLQGIINPTPLTGVSRYDGHVFRIYTIADGLAYDTVKDVFEDEAGGLWFATSSGVSHYDGEKFSNIIIEGPMGMEVLPDWWNEITTIAQDTAGNFWFGSTAGIVYYNTQTSDFRYFDVNFTDFQEMGRSPIGNVTDLLFDTKDNLWISREEVGEENSGICRYDGKKLITFPQSKELPMNSIDQIMRDSNGNLWFTGVKNLPATMLETEDSVNMIYPAVESGVSVYNGEGFQNFNTDDGLPSNSIRSVFQDSSGKLWFATNAGAAVGVYLPSENSSN